MTPQAAKTLDVERMEVLRGPQGTLSGRNTIGGASKFVSTRPTNRFPLPTAKQGWYTTFHGGTGF